MSKKDGKEKQLPDVPTLEELMAGITPENMQEGIDWGRPGERKFGDKKIKKLEKP